MQLGNTHSKSMPSKLYLLTRLDRVWTNAVRLAAVATAVEKKREPDHPPTEIEAVTPFA